MKKIFCTILSITGGLIILGSLALLICAYFASDLLQSQDKLQKSDAIVVLGGSFYRPFYAAELYQKGYAPKIYCSKPVISKQIEFLRENGIQRNYQWEVFKEILLHNGIPEKDFVFFGKANVSTVEEAEQLKLTLEHENNSKNLRLIIVTSALHTFRAGMIFRDILPDAEIIMASEPYDLPPEKWWTDFISARFIVLETAKIIFYKAGGVFRSGLTD